MKRIESEEHIEKCEKLLDRSSAPAYVKNWAKQSIRYHEDLIEMEKGGGNRG